MGLGAVLVIFNVISACRLIDRGQEIFNIVLGAWLVLSPFALGFSAVQEAAMNAMIVGGLVVVLAGWQMHDAVRGARSE
ncbi:MAG TPA: SPW repeat protein [Burkholderiales bacterium]|nr:SPW repeat protein [Burkholderiales bacterium]